MHFQIEEPIYKWLISLEVIKREGRKIKSKYELSLSTSLNLESGVLFAKLLKQLLHNTNSLNSPIPTLDTLKDFSTPTSRLFNWNILIDAYKTIDINITPDQKSLIVAGDRIAVENVLKEIYFHFFSIVPDEKKKTENDFNEFLALDSSNIAAQSFLLNESKKKIDQVEMVDLAKLNLEIPLDKTETILEFFIVSVGKNLKLTAKQAASLFTRNSKYLAHVLIKGLKGQFEPLLSFYQEIYLNIDDFLLKLENSKEPKLMISFALQSLKPGFASKSFELAQWTARLFSKLTFEFLKMNLHVACWEWFISEGGGLLSCMHCLKRHPDLKELILTILLQVGKYNFLELFTNCLNKILNDPQYFFFSVGLLIKPFAEHKNIQEDIESTGVLDYWLDFAISIVKDEFSINPDTRIEALSFLVEIWIYFPNKIEEKEEKSSEIINFLKKGTKEAKFTTKIACMTHLFRLLEYFGNNRKSFAPLLYKVLTLILIENLSSIEIKDYLTRNFLIIFENFSSIPLNIVLDPLIKQLQTFETISEIELNFFFYVSKNPRLGIKNSIQILDLLAKIFLNNLVHLQISALIITTLVTINISNQAIQDFIVKFSKIILAMLFANEKKRNSRQNSVLMQNEKEKDIMDSQKKNSSIELLKQIIILNCDQLNERLIPLIAHTNLQIKTFLKKNHKGLISLLNLIGNTEEILGKFERKSIDKNNNNEVELFEKKNDRSSHSFRSAKNTLNNNIHNKTNLTELPSLNPTKADPKLLKAIEEKSENFKKKIKEQEIKEETQLKNNINQKLKLRKQLERRILEEGLENSNSKDKEIILIYPFNSQKQRINEFEFTNLELEEDKDKMLIDNLLKNKHKLLKFIFYKYSNSGFLPKSESFKTIENKQDSISIPEIIKLFSENGYGKIIGLEELGKLAKIIVGQKNMQKNAERLDFFQFQNIIVQSAFQIYNKEKEIGINLHKLVEKLIDSFKESEKKAGNLKMFQDEDIENNQIKQITRNLEENPDYILPEGFKKITENEIKMNYDLPIQLKSSIKESYLFSYEIINDILNTKFGIQIIEPKSIIQSQTYIKSLFISPKISQTKKINPSNHKSLENLKRPPLNNNLRNLVTKAGIHRFIAEECAYLITDMINKICTNEQIIKKPKENEIKRKIKPQIIKKTFEKNHPKSETHIEKLKKENSEINKAKKDNSLMIKKKNFKILPNNKLKEEIKNHKKIAEEEKNNQKKEEEKKIENIKQLKKKEFQLFNKKAVSKLQEKFTNETISRQNKIKKEKELEEKQKKEWHDYNEIILPKKFEKETQIVNLEKSINIQFEELQKDKDFTVFFNKNEKTFHGLFDFLLKRTFTPLNFAGERKTLTLESLNNFAYQFNICPSIFAIKEIQLIYKSLTKLKLPIIYKDTISIGLNFHEFCNCLLRIASKGNSVFNLIGEKIKETGTIQEKELKSIIEKNEKKQKLSNDFFIKNIEKNSEIAILNRLKNIKDEYTGIEKTSVLTITGFLYYLGLPLDQDDRAHLDKRFREICSLKSIPNKMKKKDLQNKLEDGIRYESPKKLKNKQQNKEINIENKELKSKEYENLKINNELKSGNKIISNKYELNKTYNDNEEEKNNSEIHV